MRSLVSLLLVLSFTAPAHSASGATDVWSTKIEAQEATLSRNQEKYIFSVSAEFRAARNELLLLSTGNKAFESQWIENQTLVMPTEVFNRFLRVRNEAPLHSKIESIFKTWTAVGENTEVVVKKGFKEQAHLPEIAHSELLWLGCVSEEQCLGMTETLSNPNLLLSEVTAEEKTLLSASEIQNFLNRTANLTVGNIEQAFLKARFPKSLAKWYALKLMSRRESLIATAINNRYASQVRAFQDGEFIKDGVLVTSPVGFEVDFTLDKMNAKIREFISNRYGDIEYLAKHYLAHFPMMSYEYDKGLGGWSIGPGFMFRIKRHIMKNPHSQSPETFFRINDSVDVLITLNIGMSKKWGPATAGFGVGPGYMQKYVFSSFAPSKEKATRSTWALTKEMLLGFHVDRMKPRQSMTIESGWLANSNLSGNVEVMGQNRVRPQANLSAAYRSLHRSYIYIQDDGTALVGFGKSSGYEFSTQGFLKVIMRMAKVPFWTFSKIWMNQHGGVFEVPKLALSTSNAEGTPFSDAMASGDQREFEAKWPKVNYAADFNSSYSNLNIGIYKIAQSKWNGFFDFTPGATPSANLPATHRRFLLMEKTADEKNKFSMSIVPDSQNCATWAAFEASLTEPVHFTDGSFKISCSQIYSSKHPLTPFGTNQISEMLHFDFKDGRGLLAEAGESKRAELSWDIQLSWKDLAPLFNKEQTGWIDSLAKELEKTKREDATMLSIQEVQERFLFVMALNHILEQDTEVEKARAFFSWLSSSANKEPLIKMFLKHVSSPAVRFQIFRPFVKDSNLVEQTYSYGTFEKTTTFKIIEEKNKWLGLN